MKVYRISMEHFEDYHSEDTSSTKQHNNKDFVVTAILKRDVFSETRVGYFMAEPEKRIIRRVVTASPKWSRPLAWILAKREIRALKKIKGLNGVPQIVATDQDGLFRHWTDGTPLHLARPTGKEFYYSGFKILRNLRRMGITHNDLAKPQNWLMTPDGKASLIDFQLASTHKKRGSLYRYFSYEDFRHLVKQKNNFAPHLLTPTEKRFLNKRSWPSELWLKTGKKVYNFWTKGVFHWSDGEGTGDRIQEQGPIITGILKAHPDISDVAFTTYPMPAKGVGLYAFVACKNLTEKQIRNLLKGHKVELLQPVAELPRFSDGSPRDDILKLIAMNELNDLALLMKKEPEIADITQEIINNRLNYTDRRVHDYESNRQIEQS